MSSDELINAMISVLRKDKKYWIKDSEVYNSILANGGYMPESESCQIDDDFIEEDKSLSYSNIRSAVEQECIKGIGAVNRFMRIPRLPLVVFPMIFQFVKRQAPKASDKLRPVADWFLQNLVYTCLLRGRHHYKIEITPREVMNDQKNEKFRRKVKLNSNPSHKSSDFLHIKESAEVCAEEKYSILLEFRQFCEEEGFNLMAIFDKYHEHKLNEERLLAKTLNLCLQGYINFLTAPGSAYERVLKMTRIKLDPDIAFFFYDLREPPQYNPDKEIDYQQVEALRAFIWNQRETPGYFPSIMPHREEALDRVANKLNDFYNKPEEREKRKYRYFSDDRPEWTEQDYSKFYEALKIFNNESLANKKIAKFMGKHIDPNHVRFERQLYNKKLKQNREFNNET